MFSNQIKQNTLEEQVTILKALLENKVVYFHQFDSYKRAYEMKRFVGTSPAFDLYRYELSKEPFSKAKLFFESAPFVKAVVNKVQVTPAEHAHAKPAQFYHVEAWFEGNVLHLRESPGNAVVFHRAESQPVKVPSTKDVAVFTLEDLIRVQRAKARERGEFFRTAHVDQTGQYMCFSGDIDPYRNYRAMFKMKDCILVSDTLVTGGILVSWKIPATGAMISNGKAQIRGVTFTAHRL